MLSATTTTSLNQLTTLFFIIMPGITDDPVLIYERQEQEKEVLSKLKHTYGDFNKWITLFEDQITTCETVGVQSPCTEVHIIGLDLSEDAVVEIAHEIEDLGLLR